MTRKGDWFKLKSGDDWGNKYLSREPLGSTGTANARRAYRLQEGERVLVRLPNGVERTGAIAVRFTVNTVSDHGRNYTVRSEVPFVRFSDGTEISLTVAELQYDPERDPTHATPDT